MRQGTLIDCQGLSVVFLNILRFARANVDSRDNVPPNAFKMVVLSQDCDIHSDNVPTVELLALKKANSKERKNARFRKGRTFQKLVLPIEGEYWLGQSDWISCIKKEEFLEGLSGQELMQISEKGLAIILRWLTDKYLRRPFPDFFNKAFLPSIWDTDFGNFLEENYQSILEVYLYVYPDDEQAPSYDTILIALLNNDCDGEKEVLIANRIQEHCELLNSKPELNMLQVDNRAGEVLDVVDYAVLPEDFTKADEMRLKPLTLNYLCWPDDEE